jgi:hypothetical protein
MNSSITAHQDDITTIGHDYDTYNELTGASVISDIMNGFVWDNQHYFLQLYIPFVEDANLEEIPVICFGHQEVESTIGFKLNAQGQVEVIAVDETYAQQHLVWIVSVNEVVESNGQLPVTSPTRNMGGPRTLGRSAEVHQIYVNDKKESWIKGKGEIHMVAGVLHSWCGYRRNLPSGCMVKIAKKDEGRWKHINPSNANVAIFANGWPNDLLQDSERLCFELFEKDVHGPRSYTVCSGAPALNYRSKNSPYGSWVQAGGGLPNSTTPVVVHITTGWSGAGVRILTRTWN